MSPCGGPQASVEAVARDWLALLGLAVSHGPDVAPDMPAAERSPAGRGAQVRVVDFDAPEANDWLAVNQFTVVENRHERRPDVVLFVNGLPLGVIEMKNPADENATIRSLPDRRPRTLAGLRAGRDASGSHPHPRRRGVLPGGAGGAVQACGVRGQDRRGAGPRCATSPRELVETVRGNVTIDWTLRENVRANLRRLVKRVLHRHGYPPDKQETAIQTVLEQEVLSEGGRLEPLDSRGTPERHRNQCTVSYDRATVAGRT